MPLLKGIFYLWTLALQVTILKRPPLFSRVSREDNGEAAVPASWQQSQCACGGQTPHSPV